MVNVTPEIKEVCGKLKSQWGTVRAVDEKFFRRALDEALEYKGMRLTYWRWKNIAYFAVYRTDRRPQPVEFLPFLQELFEDGQVHEVSSSDNHIEFFQGDVYMEKAISESIGDAVADYADKKDEVEQFDFSKTELGKRIKALENGRDN